MPFYDILSTSSPLSGKYLLPIRGSFMQNSPVVKSWLNRKKMTWDGKKKKTVLLKSGGKKMPPEQTLLAGLPINLHYGTANFLQGSD